MIGLHITVATAMKAGATCALLSAIVLQPYRLMMVVGKSMEPTYSSNSLLLTETVRPDQLEKGMVVIVNMDTGPIIKRIAFMPGDEIMQAKMGKQWYDMIFFRSATKKELHKINWRRFKVPPGTVYVLGDNQRVSFDSKEFGCVSMSRITGKLVDQRSFNPFCSMGCPAGQEW